MILPGKRSPPGNSAAAAGAMVARLTSPPVLIPFNEKCTCMVESEGASGERENSLVSIGILCLTLQERIF